MNPGAFKMRRGKKSARAKLALKKCKAPRNKMMSPILLWYPGVLVVRRAASHVLVRIHAELEGEEAGA